MARSDLSSVDPLVVLIPTFAILWVFWSVLCAALVFLLKHIVRRRAA